MSKEILIQEKGKAEQRLKGQQEVLAASKFALDFAVTNKMAALAKSAAARIKRQQAAVDETLLQIEEIEKALDAAVSPQMDIEQVTEKPAEAPPVPPAPPARRR